MRRWQDWVNPAPVLWLFNSPWALDYAGATAARNAYVKGAGIVVFAALATYLPEAWEEMRNTLLGAGLVIAPFVPGFATMGGIAFHTVAIGVLVTALAVRAMFSDPQFYERWQKGHSV